MATSQSNQEATALLQWNCRSFKGKAGALQQYLNTLNPQPDVIAVQETNGPTKLPGYITYEDPSKKATATLVRNKIAATQHLTPQRGCEHTLLEILTPSTKQKSNLFVLNIYCRPSTKKPEIQSTIQDALSLAGQRPLLILGDFNAPHQLWGYKFNTKKGRSVVSAIEQHNLTLLNDPLTTTRTGTSTSRDTCPDLSLLAGQLDVTWTCSQMNLGSDHDIIHLLIRNKNYKARIGSARITNWDAFRKAFKNTPSDPNQPFAAWIDSLLHEVRAHTSNHSSNISDPKR